MSLKNVLTGEQLISLKAKSDRELPHIGEKDFSPSNSLFEKEQIQNALSERKAIIEEQRVEKSNNLSYAVWMPEFAKAKVTKRVGKHWESLGHHKDGSDWFYPEEAMVLLETNCLELVFFEIPLSIERAYSTLIRKSNGCTLEEYRAYSHLVRNGYRLFRHAASVSVTRYEKEIHLEQHILKEKELYNADCVSSRSVVKETVVVNSDVSASPSLSLDKCQAVESRNVLVEEVTIDGSSCDVDRLPNDTETNVDVINIEVDETSEPDEVTVVVPEKVSAVPQNNVKNIVTIDLSGDDSSSEDSDDDDDDDDDDDVVEVPVDKKHITFAEISSDDNESTSSEEEDDDANRNGANDDDDDDDDSEDSGSNWKRRPQATNSKAYVPTSSSVNNTKQTQIKKGLLPARIPFISTKEFLFDRSQQCSLSKEVDRFYKEIDVIDLVSDSEDLMPPGAASDDVIEVVPRDEILNTFPRIEGDSITVKTPCSRYIPPGIQISDGEHRMRIDLDTTTVILDESHNDKEARAQRHKYYQRCRQRRQMINQQINQQMFVGSPINLNQQPPQQQQQQIQPLVMPDTSPIISNPVNNPMIEQFNYLANNMLQLFHTMNPHVPRISAVPPLLNNQNNLFRNANFSPPVPSVSPRFAPFHVQNSFRRPPILPAPNQHFNTVDYRSEYQGYFNNSGSSYQSNNFTFHQNFTNYNSARQNFNMDWQQQSLIPPLQNSPQAWNDRRHLAQEIRVDVDGNCTINNVTGQSNVNSVIDLEGSRGEDFISVNSSPDCVKQENASSCLSPRSKLKKELEKRKNELSRGSNSRTRFDPTQSKNNHRFFDDDYMEGNSNSMVFDHVGTDGNVFCQDIPVTDNPVSPENLRLDDYIAFSHNGTGRRPRKRKRENIRDGSQNQAYQGPNNKKQRLANKKKQTKIKQEKSPVKRLSKRMRRRLRNNRYFKSSNRTSNEESVLSVKTESTNDVDILLLDEPEDIKPVVKTEETLNVSNKTIVKEENSSEQPVVADRPCKVETIVKEERVENEAPELDRTLDCSTVQLKKEVTDTVTIKSEPQQPSEVSERVNESSIVSVASSQVDTETPLEQATLISEKVVSQSSCAQSKEGGSSTTTPNQSEEKKSPVTVPSESQEKSAAIPVPSSLSPSLSVDMSLETESDNSDEEDVVKPLLAPKDCQSINSVLTALKIVKPASFSNENVERLKISFDVYVPSPSFKKSSRGLPNYRMVVVGYNDPFPSAQQMAELSGRFEDCIPILIAVILPESISFINCGLVNLPAIDEID